MLLVVVDQPRIRRRGDDRIKRPGPGQLARVPVHHDRLASACADARELLDPRQRVERVAAEEVLGPVDRPAGSAVLVTPVGLALRGAREVEVEVRGQPGRSRRARQHDTEHVGLLVAVATETVTTELNKEPPINVTAVDGNEVVELSDSIDYRNPCTLVEIL